MLREGQRRPGATEEGFSDRYPWIIILIAVMGTALIVVSIIGLFVGSNPAAVGGFAILGTLLLIICPFWGKIERVRGPGGIDIVITSKTAIEVKDAINASERELELNRVTVLESIEK